ncbi:MFS transporter [Paenactinomyces guangxiensis]|uniref:MFS transporter n=1 Tax=Paenactinomyces guangxiensis TaxID=1490290 RepID=UPI001E5C3620|nr:MFS transporter [Paenactinomyces guangxiensis]
MEVCPEAKNYFFTLIYGMLGMTVIQLVDAQFPVLFRELFPHSPEYMGWIISVVGLGGVLGAMWIQRVRELRYGWVLGGGLSLIGFGFGFIGLFTPGTPLMFGFLISFVAGVGVGLFFVSFNVILQKETEKKATGRVFGIENSLSSTVMIIAPLIGGGLVHLIGVSQVYVLVGLIVFVLGLLAVAFQKLIWKQKSPAPVKKEEKAAAQG